LPQKKKSNLLEIAEIKYKVLIEKHLIKKYNAGEIKLIRIFISFPVKG